MNIEIANRLVELRKKSGFSQEQLADKLGLSRQAVSKWERAEASPDTDNLICLAKLYGVSLDDLLNTDQPVEEIVQEIKEQEAAQADPPKQEAPKQEAPKQEAPQGDAPKSDSSAAGDRAGSFKASEEQIRIDGTGIHTYDKNGTKVDIDKNGIHVFDPKDGVTHVGNGRVFVHDKEYFPHKGYGLAMEIVSGSISVLCLVAYLLMGFLWTENGAGWIIGWNVFFLIPIVTSFMEAVRKRRFCVFAFPVLVCLVYLTMAMYGTVFGLDFWHPYWVEFLAIPAYYCLFGPIDKAIHSRDKIVDWSCSTSHSDCAGCSEDFDSPESLDKQTRKAKDKLDSASAKVEAAEARVSRYEQNLKLKEEDLAAAKNAPDAYEDKDDDIEDAQDELDDAKEDLGDAKEDLQEAKDDQKSAEVAYQVLLEKSQRAKRHSDEDAKVVDAKAEDKKS